MAGLIFACHFCFPKSLTGNIMETFNVFYKKEINGSARKWKLQNRNLDNTMIT